MKKITEGSVLLLNSGSCYAYTATKQSITLICITKQSKGINGFVSFYTAVLFCIFFGELECVGHSMSPNLYS
jgi:hypothetical protein